MTLLLKIHCILATTLLLASCQQASQTISNHDWPSYGHDLSSQRFSPLDQINTDNINQLTKAWQVNTGVKATFQATPIVKNGVMYVSLPFNDVLALNAVTGQQLWRYQHDRRQDWKLCCGPANRGVAVADGKVFMGTVDARLIALNAENGEKLWDIDVVKDETHTEGKAALNADDPNSQRKVSGGTGVGVNMAPIVYKGKVIIGITGVGYGLHVESADKDAPLGAVIGITGLFGRPGFLAAFDISNGKRIWQFDTIPAQGWEGEFTTKTADGAVFNRDIAKEKADLAKYPNAARFGGGSAWSTPAIDTETDTLYFGTGNPSPQMNDISRPGDNLYTVSLVALDANTGQRRWHYQQVPHDLWGYDLASPPVLFDWQHDNQSIPAVGQASKTGWFYIHDRVSGELLLKSDAFVPQHHLFKQATEEGVTVYPGILGGSNWSPVSIDNAKQVAFVSGIHAPIQYTLHHIDGDADNTYTSSEPTDDPNWGILSAINLRDGKLIWQTKTANPLVGGSLTTAGGLVFIGEGSGAMHAYDANSGELLWHDPSDFGVNAPPITYMVDGQQYISVVSGGNFLFGFKQGDAIMTYQLQ